MSIDHVVRKEHFFGKSNCEVYQWPEIRRDKKKNKMEYYLSATAMGR